MRRLTIRGVVVKSVTRHGFSDVEVFPMSRRRTIAIGSLALVLLGAPFLPDGDTPPALETSSTPGLSLTDATAGEGAVTPAMRQEIDAVLAAGRRAART